MEQHGQSLGLSGRTLRRLLAELPARPSSIKRAAKAMGIQPHALVAGLAKPSIGHPEWTLDEPLGEWRPLTDGVTFQSVRLANHVLSGAVAKGKCYDVSKLPGQADAELREFFTRHPRVVRRLVPSGFFPANYSVFYDSDSKRWWTIDEWIEGQSLDVALRVGPLGEADLYSTLLDVALALAAMHRETVIRRSLTPSSVILRAGSRRPVLSDLELSKLGQGQPTVKSLVRSNPYLAPEVLSPDSQPNCAVDVYSWGRLFVHAATGKLPPAGQESHAMKSTACSKAVKEVVLSAVTINPEKRQGGMDSIIRTLKDVVAQRGNSRVGT